MSFLWGEAAHISIEFKDQKNLKTVSYENEQGKIEHLYLFPGDVPIAGKVHVNLKKKKKLEHLGVKIELLGHIGELSIQESNLMTCVDHAFG
ncbi:hypothetical protein AAMO2058_000138200 [Amorphochlora amoebiformis]